MSNACFHELIDIAFDFSFTLSDVIDYISSFLCVKRILKTWVKVYMIMLHNYYNTF